MNNPFALVVLAAQKKFVIGKIPEDELGEHRLTIARDLIQNGKYSRVQIEIFILLLKNFIQIASPDINAVFGERIDLLTGKKMLWESLKRKNT